jgi:2-oxoisovalerate dehydrogenase E2 component (dihydrolipoyl transacylase)
MSTEVLMPKLADTLVEGTLARWLKAAHDTVQTGDAIAEIETDKVTTELTAPASGTLGDLLIAEGQTVPVGTPLVRILAASDAASGNLPHPLPANDTIPETMIDASVPTEAPTRRASPVAERMAQAHGVDLSQVQTTGNRVTRADIERHLSQVSPISPLHSPATLSVERTMADSEPVSTSAHLLENTDKLLPLAGLRRATAQRMALVHQIPTGSAVVEADVSAIDDGYRKYRDAWKKRESFSLTYTPYFIHALAQSLRAWPIARMAYINGQHQPREDVHVGIAVALDDGLIVPVLRDADQKDFVTIARELADLVERARAHRLRPEEVTGGVATLTNVGSMGGLLALPMLNENQAVILGLGAITRRVVSVNNGIGYHPQIYLSLTFDRRVLNDLQAERFLLDVAERIHSWTP